MNTNENKAGKCAICSEVKDDVIIDSFDFVPKCLDCREKERPGRGKLLKRIFAAFGED